MRNTPLDASNHPMGKIDTAKVFVCKNIDEETVRKIAIEQKRQTQKRAEQMAKLVAAYTGNGVDISSN
nr:hypothetical protein BaRGS_009309 [Batillaria attramentaria]